MSEGSAPALRATYRLQLRDGVGLADAEALVPYLAALGVSHVYCSPYVLARSGSAHGYDVVDPTVVDPALGGEPALAGFVKALRAHDMGHVLDWVPNHVGIARGENAWWQDVLEFGEASPYADAFDIDWEPSRPELRGKVLLPVLGRPYGGALEGGEIVPEWDEAGGLSVRYFEHRFPISPASGARFLRASLLDAPSPPELAPDVRQSQRELRELLDRLSRRASGPRGVERARAGKRELAARVANDPSLRRAVDGALRTLRGRPDDAPSHDAFHALLEQQHYRLAYWRVAAEEVNYRRFFDIAELAALRMEEPEVFARTHRSLFAWIESGLVDALRIDHVDGLADPRDYCGRIRRTVSRPDLVLFVEKILAADEELRDDWPVDGTTGYEFLRVLNGLFVDPRGARPLERLYRAFSGDPRSFDEIVTASKKRVMQALLAGEIEGLASRLDRVAQADRWTRDYTRGALRDALEEVVAHFPVYRTYVDEGEASPEDRRIIAVAVGEARRRAEDPGAGVLDWIERVLTGDAWRAASGARRREGLRFVTRFQQVTAPVMAKGLEDTAFYRYHRLVSLNEVGGDPRRFGCDVETFHAANAGRAARRPRTLVCSATHDTKRGEDARARLDVISEQPDDWAAQVREWARRTRRFKREVGGAPAPSRKDEYLLYQVLASSWPALEPEGEDLVRYCERVQGYMVKALREAKERSSWRHPDPEYERATNDFVAALLSPGSAFLEAFRPFESALAERGALNGLAAVALKLCSPGVPDLYQGCELWDLSLADPDNRRPVDFEARRRALTALERDLGGPGSAPPREALLALLRGWRDGRVKLFTTWRLLALRRARPDLFARGDYLPLGARGDHATRLCAFARCHADDALLLVAPRLAAMLPRGEAPFPLGRASWGDTGLALPEGLAGGSWRDVFTGRPLRARADAIDVGEALAAFPVAVLAREREERAAPTDPAAA